MRNTILRCVLLAAVAVGLSVPASAQEAPQATSVKQEAPQATSIKNGLKLTMANGRVTLVADNVPLRQILQEWARVGQTNIVNADKLMGPPLTLQIVDTPERDVLDILLRSAAGYIAAPRATTVANAAVFDRVTIMATSRPPTATAAVTQSVPTFQRPPQPIDDNDEPINVNVPPQTPQNPVTMQFPGMINGQLPNGVTLPNGITLPNTGSQPGPLTSPRPGALPQPANTQPFVIPNPYQPTQVIRPGGPGGGPGGGGN